jgi:hypothetical protein
MQFNEGVVIKIKMMNGNKVFMNTGYVKDMIKVQRMRSSGNDRITNVVNIHTCTICGPNQMVVLVPLKHGQLLKFSGNVVGGTGIKVPIGISTICGTRHSSELAVRDIL